MIILGFKSIDCMYINYLLYLAFNLNLLVEPHKIRMIFYFITNEFIMVVLGVASLRLLLNNKQVGSGGGYKVS